MIPEFVEPAEKSGGTAVFLPIAGLVLAAHSVAATLDDRNPYDSFRIKENDR